MIGATSYSGQMPVTIMRAVATGRTTVPVRPAHAPFARYKHVIGRPASIGGRYVPFHKLRILDNLIDHLIRVRTHSAEMLVRDIPDEPPPRLDESQIDAIIGRLHGEWQRAASTPGASMPTGVETGNIVNVLV